MEHGFCEFDGPRVMRWLVDDRRGDGFPANGNGHLNGGRKGVVIVEGIVKDYGAIRTDIADAGLEAWLRDRFAGVVEDAGHAMVGPEYKADEIMRERLTPDLVTRVAEDIREHVGEGIPA